MLSLILSANWRIEWSLRNCGELAFLKITLFAVQLLVWLATNNVHPPPSRDISQYAKISLEPVGLILYTPSG